MTYFPMFLGFATFLISVFVFRHTVRKDKNQNVIDLVKEFKSKPPNRYLVEKLFFEAHKCIDTSYKEVVFLLKHPEPLRAVTLYVKTRVWVNIFEVFISKGEVVINFKRFYKTRYSRGFMVLIMLLCATACVLSSVYLLGQVSLMVNNVLEQKRNIVDPLAFDASIWVGIVLYVLLVVILVIGAIRFWVSIISVCLAKKSANEIKNLYEIGRGRRG